MSDKLKGFFFSFGLLACFLVSDSEEITADMLDKIMQSMRFKATPSRLKRAIKKGVFYRDYSLNNDIDSKYMYYVSTKSGTQSFRIRDLKLIF